MKKLLFMLVVGCAPSLFATMYLHDGGGANVLLDSKYDDGGNIAWKNGGAWARTNGGWSSDTGVYISSKDATLHYPAAMENAEQGTDMGFRLTHTGDMTSDDWRVYQPARVQYRDSNNFLNAFPRNSGSVYLSFLIRADAKAFGQLNVAAERGCLGYSFGLALGPNSLNRQTGQDLARLHADGLQVGIKCVKKDVFKFVVGNKDGDDFVLLDSVETDVTYFCVVRVEINAGANGKEKISGYVVKSTDWSAMTRFQPLGEMEIYSSSESFRYIRFQSAFAVGGGAVDFDEIKVASTLEETATSLSLVSQTANAAAIKVNLGDAAAPEGLKLYVGTDAKSVAGAAAYVVDASGTINAALQPQTVHYARLGIDGGANGVQLSDQVLKIAPPADILQESVAAAGYKHGVSIKGSAPTGEGTIGFSANDTWPNDTSAVMGYAFGLSYPERSGLTGLGGSLEFGMYYNGQATRTQCRKFTAEIPDQFYLSALIRPDEGPLTAMRTDSVFGIGLSSYQIDVTADKQIVGSLGFSIRKTESATNLCLYAFGEYVELANGEAVRPRETYLCVAKVKKLGGGKYQISASAVPTFAYDGKERWDVVNREVTRQTDAPLSYAFVTGQINNNGYIVNFDELRVASTYHLATGGKEAGGMMVILR